MTVHRAPVITQAAVLVVVCALVPLAACNRAQQAPEELRALAEQGDADAQFNLGVMYGEGLGVPQDDAEAGLTGVNHSFHSTTIRIPGN